MPRYFFFISDGHLSVDDEEGSELGDDGQARDEAIAAVRDLLCRGDALGLCRRHWLMTVREAGGRLVLRLPFGHALEGDTLTIEAVRGRP